eukprot:CAMPEP_0183363858 /NCGR_PEP_ID=MMETSP0164_2-20130417/77222_1 /TAXON_ID=221442 /ORGANISM="Coccolithus pelagicus ssp braarudi, Strain PLY182g" /LENGTH=69 /DNA_ID=CAMNT_0025539051 /DNA_START=40 /DNA_END=249 /DNA_ORIENTATION=-
MAVPPQRPICIAQRATVCTCIPPRSRRRTEGAAAASGGRATRASLGHARDDRLELALAEMLLARFRSLD